MNVVSVHEALAVTGRATGWLIRDGGKNLPHARYMEATLAPWIDVVSSLGDDAVTLRDSVVGFDMDEMSGQAERLARIVATLPLLRASAGEPPAEEIEPRARLLPEGVGSDVPPPMPPMPHPNASPAEGQALDAPVPDEGARGTRGDRGDGSDRGDRAPRSERAPRPDRGDRATRADRPAGGDRQERQERPERGDRGDRGDRADRHERNDRRPVDAPPRPPEPPPEPRLFPLGTAGETGESLGVLGVLTEAEVEVLASQGIESIADLLLRPPIAVDRAGERLVDGVPPEGPVLLRGKVSARITRFTPHGRRRELTLTHDRGVVRARWVGALPPEVANLRTGSEVGLVGRYELDDEVAVLYEAEPLGVDGRGGDWLPTYGLADISEARVRVAMRVALRTYADALMDHLPPDLLDRYKLLPLAAALRDVHFPSNASRRGRARLAFDELLQIQLGIALLRARPVRERGAAHPVAHALVTQALSLAGWYFTDPQEAAFDAIRRDLRRSMPMERLLQGDVGSGKVAVLRAAMLMVAESRQQVFFCAPDALSAENAWLFAGEFFRSVKIEPLLLLGAPTRTQAEALKKGETLVVYGTHALMKQPPELRKLGLLVVEQHGGYGIPDLSAFDGQGHRPDLLVTTPTPVPALLALTAYGQLAMTVVDPPHCRGVETVVLGADHRADAYAAARDAIAAGEQVILVFPLLRGRDLLSPSEARRLSEVLAAEYLPGARFSIFSGALSREERFRAYDDFQHRRSDVLLATTVLEDGPIVPNASIMIVERADTYELVRLHRLRNHVHNGWRRGHCFLVESEEPRPEARRTLELVAKEKDGFRIADLDLAQRGADAVLAAAAAVDAAEDEVVEGVETLKAAAAAADVPPEDVAPRFAWADPAEDRDTLTRARAEAFKLIAADPGLKRRLYRPLLNIVRARFGEEAFSDTTPTLGASSSASSSTPPVPTADARRRRRRRGR